MKPRHHFLRFACIAALASPVGAAEIAPRVQETWKGAEYRFTPAVEAAFLEAAKTAALQKIAATGKSLPADFLAWVDGDPVVKTTVYGARQDPSGWTL